MAGLFGAIRIHVVLHAGIDNVGLVFGDGVGVCAGGGEDQRAVRAAEYEVSFIGIGRAFIRSRNLRRCGAGHTGGIGSFHAREGDLEGLAQLRIGIQNLVELAGHTCVALARNRVKRQLQRGEGVDEGDGVILTRFAPAVRDHAGSDILVVVVVFGHGDSEVVHVGIIGHTGDTAVDLGDLVLAHTLCGEGQHRSRRIEGELGYSSVVLDFADDGRAIVSPLAGRIVLPALNDIDLEGPLRLGQRCAIRIEGLVDGDVGVEVEGCVGRPLGDGNEVIGGHGVGLRKKFVSFCNRAFVPLPAGERVAVAGGRAVEAGDSTAVFDVIRDLIFKDLFAVYAVRVGDGVGIADVVDLDDALVGNRGCGRNRVNGAEARAFAKRVGSIDIIPVDRQRIGRKNLHCLRDSLRLSAIDRAVQIILDGIAERLGLALVRHSGHSNSDIIRDAGIGVGVGLFIRHSYFSRSCFTNFDLNFADLVARRGGEDHVLCSTAMLDTSLRRICNRAAIVDSTGDGVGVLRPLGIEVHSRVLLRSSNDAVLCIGRACAILSSVPAGEGVAFSGRFGAGNREVMRIRSGFRRLRVRSRQTVFVAAIGVIDQLILGLRVCDLTGGDGEIDPTFFAVAQIGLAVERLIYRTFVDLRRVDLDGVGHFVDIGLAAVIVSNDLCIRRLEFPRTRKTRVGRRNSRGQRICHRASHDAIHDGLGDVLECVVQFSGVVRVKRIACTRRNMVFKIIAHTNLVWITRNDSNRAIILWPRIIRDLVAACTEADSIELCAALQCSRRFFGFTECIGATVTASIANIISIAVIIGRLTIRQCNGVFNRFCIKTVII